MSVKLDEEGLCKVHNLHKLPQIARSGQPSKNILTCERLHCLLLLCIDFADCPSKILTTIAISNHLELPTDYLIQPMLHIPC